MKRKLMVVGISMLLICSLASCGGKKDEQKDTKKEASEQAAVNKQEDKAEGQVEVTLPAAVFDEEGMAQIDTRLKSDGVKSIQVNEDGSVTYKMSRNQHIKLLDAVKGEIDKTIAQLLEDKTSYPSYESISYNADVTEFQIKVDSAFTETEAFGALPLYAIGSTYQGLNFISEDQINTNVVFVNKDTGEVLKSQDAVSMGSDYQK